MWDWAMTKELHAELEQEEKDNVVSLQLITGGKEPPSTGSNWMDGIEEGSLFFVQSKIDPMDFNLGLFRMEKREGKVTVLLSPQMPGTPLYVSSTRFCNKFLLFENLGIVKEKEEEKEIINDGDRLEGQSSDEAEKVE